MESWGVGCVEQPGEVGGQRPTQYLSSPAEAFGFYEAGNDFKAAISLLTTCLALVLPPLLWYEALPFHLKWRNPESGQVLRQVDHLAQSHSSWKWWISLMLGDHLCRILAPQLCVPWCGGSGPSRACAPLLLPGPWRCQDTGSVPLQG